MFSVIDGVMYATGAFLIDQAWQLKAEMARTPSATTSRAPAQPAAEPRAR
jgi:hypothetical protein